MFIIRIVAIYLGGSMKKLNHVHERKPEAPEISRRQFFKMGATTMGLLACLQFGGAAATLISPRTASAEAAETRDINGVRVPVYRLENTISDLDRSTRPFRRGETRERTDTGEEVYSYALQVSEQQTRFSVVSQTLTVNVDGRDVRLKNWHLVVRFPPSREQNPDAEGAGSRVIGFSNFAESVRVLSGQEMSKVYVVMETGTFDRNGTQTWFANVHIFPLNEAGDVITRRASREYLVYSGVYYGDSFGAEAKVLIEPRDTMARVARR